MKESVAIAKGADRKKDFLPTKSDNGIHHVQHEPERQLGSLRSVINTIRSDGGTPSVESIATELSSMHNAERAPVLLALQRTHGNRYVQRVAAGIQAKLKVGQPGDIYEQEADRVAGVVMRMSEPQVQRQSEEEKKLPAQAKTIAPIQTLTIQCQDDEEEEELKKKKKEEEEEEELIMAKGVSGKASEVSDNLQARLNQAKGGGQYLPKVTRTFMEERFGVDFSGVRVHTNSEAASLNRHLNARAFTIGQDIFFRCGSYNPGNSGDRELLAHELTHVVQQSKGMRSTATLESRAQKSSGRHLAVGAARVSVSGPIIKRKIVPEDVAIEMIGREFEVTGTFRSIKAGDRVTVLFWDNASESVYVYSGGARPPFYIPKRLLKPTRTAVAGIAPYGAGVAPQAAAVEKTEKKLAAWIAMESSYKTKKAVVLFKEERKRLEGLLVKQRKVLNRKLIQETMFNRFDATIKKEVDKANKAHGLKGAAALDPNLVKSMLFQESQLGTAGTHLEVPPSHPVKTRFNIGQVIDSSGLALMTLLEKEQPILMALCLPSMRKDLEDAQKERKKLKGKKTLTPAETVRLAELNSLAAQNWEVFIWGYQSPGLFIRFADVVNSFFASQSPALNVDYGFWIHLAVFWLFEKHKPGRSWPDTIMAYNGTGAKAKHYRDAVVKRSKSAASAAKAGKEFIPANI